MLRSTGLKTLTGLTYDTPADNFGPHSLDIFVYCFTRTTAWKDFLEGKQKFFLSIVREMRALKVNIAFPIQTLHIASTPEGVPFAGSKS